MADVQEKIEVITEVISESNENKPEKLSVKQLLNLCIGFFGLQFAWSMQIGLSGRVTEPLGATPLIFGLMWLAGPITGILVQPIIGVISDNIMTKIGRRRPFLIVGAIIGSLALLAFPNSLAIATKIGIPAIILAAAVLWIIDASVNISQGPYRALIPDIAPQEQHAVANSYLSFAIGLGSVISFGSPLAVKILTGYQMSIYQQFIMAAIAFTICILYTSLTTKENTKLKKNDSQKESALEPAKNFGISALISLVVTGIIFLTGKFDLSNKDSVINLLSLFVLITSVPMLGMALMSFKSKEVFKLCAVQFFTWLGMMSLFIYFNNYVVHNIYQIPDLSAATEAIKASFNAKILQATNISGGAFALLNLVCFLVSLPLGYLCTRFGKKNVHAAALTTMGLSFLGLAFIAKSTLPVFVFMGVIGLGWASILALPFALLTEHIQAGTEGSAMGKFNLFIAGPQLLTSVAIGFLINKSPMSVNGGMAHHWEYAFIVGGFSVLIAAIITLTVKEKGKTPS